MFGLAGLFNALARLTRSVNTSADLFDAANEQLRKQFGLDAPEAPALEHKDAEAEPARNGRGRKAPASA